MTSPGRGSSQEAAWVRGGGNGAFLGSFRCAGLMEEEYGCRRTSKKLLFALELVLPASSFLIPDQSGINP